jgi:radical SAM superfamily enzyme YgiQ (UPF0313 family)
VNSEYSKGKGFHIITARGCPYNCNFCLGKEQRSPGLRYHSIDYVVGYVKAIVDEYAVRSFNIVDDIFVIRPARVGQFCSMIQETIPQRLRFHCFTHAGHGSVKLYALMKEAGFHTISMGVEHGNDRILSMMGKNTTKAKIEETCAAVCGAGIGLNLTYVLGNIHETNGTISETVDFAIYLHNKYRATSWFSFMQPLPGSPVFDVAERFGMFLSMERRYQNTEACFVPHSVDVEHMVRERDRGMKLANPNGGFFSRAMSKLVRIVK